MNILSNPDLLLSKGASNITRTGKDMRLSSHYREDRIRVKSIEAPGDREGLVRLVNKTLGNTR